MKTICGRIKLKDGSLPRVKQWKEELNRRSDEAYETLRDEGVFIESVFLEKAEDADYLIYFMKLQDQDKANDVVSKSKHAIDAYHIKFKQDCWESNQDLELLVDFDRYAELHKGEE